MGAPIGTRAAIFAITSSSKWSALNSPPIQAVPSGEPPVCRRNASPRLLRGQTTPSTVANVKRSAASLNSSPVFSALNRPSNCSITKGCASCASLMLTARSAKSTVAACG